MNIHDKIMILLFTNTSMTLNILYVSMTQKFTHTKSLRKYEVMNILSYLINYELIYKFHKF